ncbi:MAG TPA: hypothetical protein VN693_00480 [Rhodanobacteraceae bacterium]|nr:hypothetical protein [Rhodanobacteraceae bacterium]
MAASAAAAAVIAREKRIVREFREAGATSADKAVAAQDIGVHGRVAFKRLVEHAVLREAGNGRFYLDEQKWQALRRLRLRIVLIMLLLVALVGLSLFGYFMRRG